MLGWLSLRWPRRKEQISIQISFWQTALERFIEVIGEAASEVSPTTRASASKIPWGEIIGMRNRLVHGYASVDHDIVWDVVSGDLTEVIDGLETLLVDRPPAE